MPPMDHKKPVEFWLFAVVFAVVAFCWPRVTPAQKDSASYSTPASEIAPFDVIIKNGHILDGSGGPWYAADIGIHGDRIVAIGKLGEAPAKKVIDAEGKIVSPGFIDMLGQSEFSLLIDNRSLSKLSQGITTEITGEGGSIAPQNGKTLAQLAPSWIIII